VDRKKLLYVACGVACLLFAAVLLHNADGILRGFSKHDDVVEESIEVPKESAAEFAAESQPSAQRESGQAPEGECVVYVVGSVKHPGVYTVPQGTRIYKVLSLAGGFTEDADKAAVNLAATVSDGVQINFPNYIETAQKGYRTGESSSRKSASDKNYGYNSSSNSSKRRSSSGEKSVASLVDLNKASEEELNALPGVGAKTAALIVEYRQRHGRFERKEDLLEIRGIGVKKYEKLRDYVTVGE